ncbi:MAG: selenocysteine-specific translation elongation factor [Polyangiales bacterium]
MAVLGTAGHVDHGKTTLVRALTGIDTDRLPEEKRRGITIELGFAPLAVKDPDGRERTVAIVDVPGHERFVGTMVGGAQGVDVALLVVAADAGVMPQTREHLVILGSLGVRTLLVALTRSDLADDETRALAKVDVEDALAHSPWPKAQIFEVSGATGAGIPELRAAIAAATRPFDSASDARIKRPARLAIDRAFVPKGQGVVVTGTLVAGTISVGEDLELVPAGRKVRVRSAHQYGHAVTKASASGRLALGLSGVELAEVHRGEVLVNAGTLAITRAFDAVLLRPRGGRAFGRRARLSINIGTDEVSARLVPIAPLSEDLELKTTIAGGETWLVRAVLERPVGIAVGDRAIVRGDAPLAGVGTTLGSLEILRTHPGKLHGGRAKYGAFLRGFREADTVTRARLEIESSGLSGLTSSELATRLVERTVGKELARTLAPLEAKSGGTTRYVGESARSRARAALLDGLGRFHEQHPDLEGAPHAEALANIPANAAQGLAESTLDRAVAAGEVVRAGERVRRSTFKPAARADDPQARAIVDRLRVGALAPPTLVEIAKELGLDATRARALASATGEVVHVQGDLWFDKPSLDELRTRLVAYLKEHGSITTGAFKDLVGSSRKYVVPLAEWFDGQKVTLRVGEVRKLRGG